MQTTERLLLSKKEVAELTGLGVRTVERLAARGVLRGIRPAGMRCVRYQREAVEKWVRDGCRGR